MKALRSLCHWLARVGRLGAPGGAKAVPTGKERLAKRKDPEETLFLMKFGKR
jgi:hypothetical protein